MAKQTSHSRALPHQKVCSVALLTLLLSLVCIGAIPSQLEAVTIRVPTNFPTIQGAINAAVDGDTVLVAPGTYVENINFNGKAITVTSEQGPEVTIIDGNKITAVVVFNSGEGLTSALSGFAIRNGATAVFPSLPYGGGVYLQGSSPTIVGNRITNNDATIGGGIYVYAGSPLIQGNRIENNRSFAGFGGGIAVLN